VAEAKDKKKKVEIGAKKKKKAPGETGSKGELKEKQKKEKPKKELKPKVPSEWEKRYSDECVPGLMEQFKFRNRMQVPRLSKIVINTSIKEALLDVKILQTVCEELAVITGQRPVITKAKKSIANFKLRQGQSIGACVTLRGSMMYEFMSKLVNVALPRVRDFKGISTKAFDGRGNYTLGLIEQTIFSEINFDKIQRQYGMNITFVTTAENNEHGMALLQKMGMPFKDSDR